MPDPLTHAPVPLLFYTSHSPHEKGLRDCPMERYVEYHAGRHGSGYRRTSTAVPLVTGGAVHKGMQFVGEWILEWQAKNPQRRLMTLPDPVIAWAATEAAVRYEQRARAKGLQLTQTDAAAMVAVEQLIMEQRTLVEALVWMYCLVRLPYMLSEYKLFDVEFEETPVLDCTCGLGDWNTAIDIHKARSCQGIVSQAREDFTWEAVADLSLVAEEFKTKATERASWEQAWEHSAQLWLNMEAKSRRLGRPVNTAFVPVLFKGWRGKERGAGPEEPKWQHSTLCWAWYDPGGLPLREPNWSSKYRWTDEFGRGHTLPRTYTRVPIWDESRPLPPVPLRPEASRVERWIKNFITPAQYAEHVKILGPFPRPQHRLEDATAALLAEERKWRKTIKQLREAGAYEPAHPLVSQLVPRSWNCTKYDGTPCMAKPICDKQPGWDAIESMAIYERRTPHHAPERTAFEELGWELPPPDDEFVEEGDEP